jgi:hypothetical protein
MEHDNPKKAPFSIGDTVIPRVKMNTSGSKVEKIWHITGIGWFIKTNLYKEVPAENFKLKS